MLVVFQRCLPFFLPCLKKKVTNIFIARKRPKTHISPTEKVVNEHEKMLARVSQGCTTAVHTCEKHCRLLGDTPEHVNNNFSGHLGPVDFDRYPLVLADVKQETLTDKNY